MQRIHQIVFVVSLLALSWLSMMAVHELGHVVGAWATGGSIQQVILNPLTISQTEVEPNPQPLVVVWLGPIIGCLVPLMFWFIIPRRWQSVRSITQFFAGFCLIANGAYITFGSIERVGDCGEMIQHGSPIWTLLLFGTTAMAFGLYVWHRMGSIKDFYANSSVIDPVIAYSLLAMLLVVVAIESSFATM